jgi:chromosome segregation ATPase
MATTNVKAEREIATVKADIAAMGHLFTKLDTTLEKLEENSGKLSSIIAVHEERLNNQEDNVAVRKREVDLDIKELHSRITTAGRENQEQHKVLQNDMSETKKDILEAINELRKDISKEQERLDNRIKSLEQWRWILLGILLAVSALLPNLPGILKIFG